MTLALGPVKSSHEGPRLTAPIDVPEGGTPQPEARPQSADRPLCVDLDGTLIATDALWESFLLLLKSKPWLLFLVPVWYSRGKAQMKRKLVAVVCPDPASLPYRTEVLAYITAARDAGRPALLVTASDQQIADGVGAHLGIFDEVIGSDGETNLKGKNKAKLLEERHGRGGFDYIGDSPADLPLWEAAHTAVAVDPRSGVAEKARQANERVDVIRPELPSALRAGIKALRPHQWLKNLLLFVAPILAHRTEPALWLQVVLGFVAFSFTASSVYILNDLLDLESDRQHRTKKRRPFASGALSIQSGLAMFPVVLLSGVLTSAAFLPWPFTAALLGYWILTTAYSFYLKRKMVVDVLTLASLFTYRVLAGGLAAEVAVSEWLLGFSMFFFLGLAFVKRYSELVQTQQRDLERIPGRGYWVVDLQLVTSFGPASGFMAVLVFCLYIASPQVKELYSQPQFLWLIAPILLYWIARVWFLAGRDQLHDDPVLFAVRDRHSYLAGILTLICLVLAAYPFG